MKKATFDCIGNGMCGWVRRWRLEVERWGACIVVLPKVTVGLSNLDLCAYLVLRNKNEYKVRDHWR